ncbi:unnamed protein product [Danaus chrysippus]|uniref:(African queen) hypothetical protein n=1 Tax=Danaus chrysippus TaxID=151541 RepID=A0A8J2WD95_9NEOP|nr:unnamed protein product [Danaus chrysippus]
MTRKFLFCFPLRLGNLVFGYIVIIISLIVAGLSLQQLVLSIFERMIERDEERFGNFQKLETIFGEQKKELVKTIILIYYLCYVIIGLLLFIFGVVFTSGVHKVSYRAISTFFCYSFVHIFLTIALIVWEGLTAGWIQLGLIVLSDVLLIVCLFSVKYLMEAIRTGNIYCMPGEVLYQY